MSEIDLRVRFNNKLYSVVLNDYRIGGCKWNDIEHGKYIEFPVNKEDVFVALGVDKTIANLQSQLDQVNEKLKCAIVPKFKKDEYVYALFTQTEIYKGQIDAFDYYTNSYLIYPNEDIGNEWIKADKVFKTKSEAEKKLQELRGGGCHSN